MNYDDVEVENQNSYTTYLLVNAIHVSLFHIYYLMDIYVSKALNTNIS